MFVRCCGLRVVVGDGIVDVGVVCVLLFVRCCGLRVVVGDGVVVVVVCVLLFVRCCWW